MGKLSRHQQEALKRFPSEGWHRVDRIPEWWLIYVRHNDHTAEILERKGYLESRVLQTPGTTSAWGLYREYRKIAN